MLRMLPFDRHQNVFQHMVEPADPTAIDGICEAYPVAHASCRIDAPDMHPLAHHLRNLGDREGLWARFEWRAAADEYAAEAVPWDREELDAVLDHQRERDIRHLRGKVIE